MNVTRLAERSLDSRKRPAVTRPNLTPGVVDKAASLFRALGDPTRLRLYHLVAHPENSSACSYELARALGVSAPTVTHHMKKLTAAGLVMRTQAGKWAHFRVDPNHYAAVNAVIEEYCSRQIHRRTSAPAMHSSDSLDLSPSSTSATRSFQQA